MFSKIKEWLWKNRKQVTIFVSLYFLFFYCYSLIGSLMGIDIRLDKVNLILAYFFGILAMILFLMIYTLLIIHMNEIKNRIEQEQK
ncbi:MAG: hypothetical protein ACP5IZ_07730 [Thermoprotei archaeon]|jgi:uncharacterized membrane protein required for colicin V production